MLTQRVDLFDSTYGHFTEDVLAERRLAEKQADSRTDSSSATQQ